MTAFAEPIPIDRPKRGRPTIADVLRIELDSRRVEERRMARDAAPLVSRMYLVAHEMGPATWQVVAALDHLLTRHARRWTPDQDGGAA